MKTATLSAIVAAVLASAAPLGAQTASLNATADARVLSGAGNTNYGSQDVLSLHHSSGNVQRTFVNFDLTGYAGVSLTSDAVLTLRASGSGGTALTGVYLGTANAAWAENTITWNNQPGITVVPGVTNPNGTYAHNSDVTWTVPWYVVEKWATTGYHGIGLTSGMNSGRHFLSKEGGVAPKLEFAYADSQDGVWIGGAGNWTDAGNWQGGSVARGIDRSATFHGFTAAAATLDADHTVGSLSFDNADHTIAAGAGRLAFSTTAGIPTVFVGTGRTASIGAPILGLDGLAKTGTGTLVLNGPGSTSQSLTAYQGTLEVGGGSLTVANDLFVGGTAFQGNDPSFGTLLVSDGTMTVNGAFILGQTVNGANQVAQYTQTGGIVNQAGTSLHLANGGGVSQMDVTGGTFTSAGTMNVGTRGSAALNVGGDGTMNVNGLTMGHNAGTATRDTAVNVTGNGTLNVTGGNIIFSNHASASSRYTQTGGAFSFTGGGYFYIGNN